MGYRRKNSVYDLKWSQDQDLHGLEIAVGGLTIDRMLKLVSLGTALSGDDPRKMETADEMFRMFARCLLSWNLEDEEGRPVPATYEGVAAQEPDFVIQMVNAWIEAVVGVDPTSQPAANGTGTFPEVSLPMEPLSVSLPN